MTGSLAKLSSVSDHLRVIDSLESVALEANCIHLWLARNDSVASSDAFKRAVLSSYVGAPAAELRFDEGEHGKPALAGGARSIEFNLSHSGDWLVCAVSRAVPVGVDLEYCDPRRASLKVARRYFRSEELALLETCPDQLREQRFFDYWTLKECAVKARGEALAPGLKAYGFDFSVCENGPGHIARFTDDSADTATYFLLDPLENYRMALCWMGDGSAPAVNLMELDSQGAATERTVSLRATSLTPAGC